MILDADLARIYAAQTKGRSEQVRRKSDRVPPDFVIQLTLGEAKEIERLRSQIATLKKGQHILSTNGQRLQKFFRCSLLSIDSRKIY